ncbi:MAG: hypothetical protein JF627_03825 [Alphaproteobacteria bacterium]|nr:hypothetical protein [Alphaproteobacteria bacterium]
MTKVAERYTQSVENELPDEDRDSLHTLAISVLPVKTQIFRRARLVKNSRLDSVIEFFNGVGCGRGQMDLRHTGKFLALPEKHPDVELLQKVGMLPSFDVYSLRIQLRAHGIIIPDGCALTLSPGKIEALSAYMATFTRPLVAEIFSRDTEGSQFRDIVGMFRAENAEAVRGRLGKMADRLGIPVEAIPKFLEDYGDIFMSLSYYRHCLDELLPQVQNFMDGIAMVRASHQLAQDRSLMGVIDMIEEMINGKLANITGKIESFERSTNDMWRNLSGERFQRIEALISGYHTSIGGSLCAMSVKMAAWTDQFPNATGGVGRRAAFIMSDMRQGIELLQKSAEDDAPMLSALNG